ncbi:MAG: hypothetical protein DRG59_10905 [Deltaproteobacteria bacterium]|nr:MAG: hypothetical protein DRG59_10905 [Deltaproteobacteria bacterium]
MTLLKRVLDRALPFKSPGAEVFAYVRFANGGRWWGICCRDYGSREWWWERFRRKYSNYLDVGRRYSIQGEPLSVSPEFPSLDNLINWLGDVLQLPPSVRDLLKIEILSKLGMYDE